MKTLLKHFGLAVGP